MGFSRLVESWPLVRQCALVLAGELALRWSVLRAGFQSVRDPRYTVIPQKQRLSA